MDSLIWKLDPPIIDSQKMPIWLKTILISSPGTAGTESHGGHGWILPGTGQTIEKNRSYNSLFRKERRDKLMARIRRHGMDFSVEREKYIQEKVDQFNQGNIGIRDLIQESFDEGRYTWEREQEFDKLFELKNDVLKLMGQRLQGIILINYQETDLTGLIEETIYIVKEINKISLDSLK